MRALIQFSTPAFDRRGLGRWSGLGRFVTLLRAIMQTLKPYVQSALKRAGLYYRLRASPAYTLYWEVVDRSLICGRSKEVNFYRNLLYGLRKGALIFDIGANEGTKTDTFLRLGASVVAVEPDQTNQEILRQKYLKYRLVQKPVVVVGKAVSDGNAVETMWIDEPGSALNSLSPKWVEGLRADQKRFGQSLQFAAQTEVETVTIEGLINQYGPPFFIKIDVEGSELRVLRGMRRPVPYLSFEVNLPEFLDEGLQCVQLLGRIADNGKFNYAVDCKQGLVLKQWFSTKDFLGLLAQSRYPSVEVFWRTGLE